MPDNEKPRGYRFTHVYAERGKPTQDSARMRRRLASLIDSIDSFKQAGKGLAERAERELGVAAPWSQIGAWREFLEKWNLKDVLDLVTVAYQFLVEEARRSQYSAHVYTRDAKEWIAETRRIFQEENVHYILDDRGGVHFQFDEQFARERSAAIASLQADRYANARHAFNGAMDALSATPPDGKNAVRGVFSAAENVFKLMNSKDRLGTKEADEIGDLIDKLYSTDQTARLSARKMLASFKGWIDAAHFYRHEPGTEAIAQPPLDLTIYLVGVGAAHLRWLADLDGARSP